LIILQSQKQINLIPPPSPIAWKNLPEASGCMIVRLYAS
jgi:hypothetical protein